MQELMCGMQELVPLTLPSAKAAMTLPRADKLLFMFFASSKTAPSAPVLLTYAT